MFMAVHKNTTTILIVLVAAALVLQAAVFVYSTTNEVTAQASTSFSVCINQEPIFTLSCNTTLTQDTQTGCDLNATDADGESLSYTYSNLTAGMDVTLYQNGTFYVTPNSSQVTNHTIRFSAQDAKNCSNSATTLDINFQVINVNDAPVYIGGITSPLEWAQGSSLRGIFLDDYFFDADGDDLNYSASFAGSGFSVNILESSEIILQVTSCGTDQVIFSAIDPSNASGSSDVITLSVDCPQESSSSGGGGGSTSVCKEEWRCDEWGRCSVNGTQKQKCTDINGCDLNNYIKYFYRECQFIPHCENGILDYDERGVDCGGSCPACQTCSDNIRNNQEIEIDCGGPNCPACQNCNDGIKNYQEEDVDCGGPHCSACASCFDGIQNNNETGVDCGGPNCSPCSRLETPGVLRAQEGLLNTLLIIAVALGVAAFIAYRFFKRQLHVLFSKILWTLLRSRRKDVLLSDHQVDELFNELLHLEKEEFLSSNKQKEHDQYQDDLARLSRQFFTLVVGSAVERQAVRSKINNLPITPRVKNILKHYYDILLDLEKTPHLDVFDLQIYTELFRQRLISLSNLDHKKIVRRVEEVEPHEKNLYLRCKHLLYNATLALQFQEVELAKKKYMEALKIYEHLVPKQQEEVYSLLHLTFDDLLYVASYTQIH